MKRIYLQNQQDDPNVEHIDFPTGEKHIRIRNLTYRDSIMLVYHDPSGDLMKLAMAVDICREADVESISLRMDYVPYARQDRRATEGDPFSLKVFANFINSFGFDKVYINDPHSEITPALINNVVVTPQHQLALGTFMQLNEFVRFDIALVAPDLGAAKKIKALQAHIVSLFGIEAPIIQCDKVRCPKTGKLTGFKILDGDPSGKHCLMVDDIADGAGTQVGLAKLIKVAGAEEQSLFVTHGVFSKGVNHVLEVFDYVYTTNSFPKKEGVRVLNGSSTV